jgi:excisionase family DNA binding protein
MARRNSEHPDYGVDAITLHEAACRLGMHPRTYTEGVEHGKLPGTKWGKTVNIPRHSYELYLKLGRLPRIDELEVAA